jgi:hypothetical protein
MFQVVKNATQHIFQLDSFYCKSLKMEWILVEILTHFSINYFNQIRDQCLTGIICKWVRILNSIQ